jgi:hypothetical protein
MTVTIHSTTKIVHLNGVPCRVWEGQTERGIPIHCFISRIAVEVGLDSSELNAELQEQARPSAEIAALPPRMVI